MLALHSLSLSKSLISSHVFSELIASMTKVWVSPFDFALASLAQLSLVRSAAVSKSVNHSSNFVESCSLKMAMSCSREFVRFVCFCVVHSVSVYWCTTSPNGSVGAGVEVSCALSMRERFCSSHSMFYAVQSLCWLTFSMASTCCHKLFISLVSMVKFAWLLGKRSPRQPSTSDPPKASIVSELFVLSLSLLGPISMPLVSSTWELRSLSLPVCPVPLWQVVIAWVLYVAQYD